MIGILVNDNEIKELEYLLIREMEELLHDFEDERIDDIVKEAMEERYQSIFNLFKRFATDKSCTKYIRSFKYKKINGYQ